ncbi:MAG: FHA domain-containing protein [Phycisphaerae bacterium]|nr:FHA domain-containing protein [Phycisphaerae bacterium]
MNRSFGSQGQAGAAPAYVEIESAHGQVRRCELVKDFVTIGRSPQTDISIDDEEVSRVHASIERTDRGRWSISDLGSTNGIRFGDGCVRSHVLRQGDRIRMGRAWMTFHDPTGASDAPRDEADRAPTSEETIGRGDVGRRSDAFIQGADEGEASRTVATGGGTSRRRALCEVTALTSASHAGELAPSSDLDGGYVGREDEEARDVAPALQLGTVWRFKWTILAVFILVAAGGVLAVRFLLVPEYRAMAQVRVRPIIPRLVFPTEDNGLIPLYTSYLNTQVSVMRSPTILERVLDQPEVRETGAYRRTLAAPGGSPAEFMAMLHDQLEIKPQRQTEVIELAISARDARDAAVLVNAILDQYLKYVHETSEQIDDFVYRKLSEEATSLRGEIEGREQVADRLRKELGTGSPEDLVAQKRVRLDEMQARLAALQKDILISQWRRSQLPAAVSRPSEAGGGADRPSRNPSAYRMDPEWQMAQAEILQVKREIAGERLRLGERHPQMTRLRERLKFAEDLLAKREAAMDEHPVEVSPTGPIVPGQVVGRTDEPQSLEQRIGLLKYEEQLDLKEIEQERRDLTRVFEGARTLSKENEAVERARELYKAVRSRLDQKMIERNVPGSIDVLARASVPLRPDRDRRMKLTIVVLLGALGIGFVVAFLRARASTALHDVRDIPRLARVPFLGHLPWVGPRDLASAKPADDLVESVRLLRTILLQRLPRSKGSVIQITGAGPMCGKTTVSELLGRGLAQCGKEILLVDTDFRKPSLTEHFGLENRPGLVASLCQETSDPGIVATETPGLSVLPAGVFPESIDREVLANGAFASRLGRWRKDYDVILLDSAPVLPVADASILARHADGTIMVVREGHCHREEVSEAFHDLVSSGGHLLGTIFVTTRRRGRYASRYYDRYYRGSGGDHGSRAQREPRGADPQAGAWNA